LVEGIVAISMYFNVDFLFFILNNKKIERARE
jgi:hypothetical protein